MDSVINQKAMSILSKATGVSTDDLCDVFGELVEKISRLLDNLTYKVEEVENAGLCFGQNVARPRKAAVPNCARKQRIPNVPQYPGKEETSNRCHLKKPP